MPHYFFDIKNGHRLIDPTGLECRDDQEATAQATAIAAQIALDVPGSAGVRHVAVLNGAREQIGKVPVFATGENREGIERTAMKQSAQRRGEEAIPARDTGEAQNPLHDALYQGQPLDRSDQRADKEKS
jgi:hypothetical protein